MHAAVCWNVAAVIAVLLLANAHRPPFDSDESPFSTSAQEALLRHPPRQLTKAERDSFARDGALLIRNVIPESVAVEARAIVHATPPRAPPRMRRALRHSANRAWNSHLWARTLTFSGLGASLAAQLVDSGGERDEATLLNSIVYGVGAHDPGALWHVDAQSFRPSGGAGLSIWYEQENALMSFHHALDGSRPCT